MKKKKTILVSNPSLPGVTFLPYLYSLLRLRLSKTNFYDLIQWAKPVYQSDLDISQSTSLKDVDILIISCYAWNVLRNLELADRLKAINPDALIIAGGPEPDWASPEIFANEFKNVDIISRNEIEISGPQIIEAYLNQSSFNQIEALMINQSENRMITPISTKKHDLQSALSPYTWDFYELSQIRRQIPSDESVYAVLETNRGCPYMCSFCDWGSSTFSKVRIFTIDRVFQDIEHLAKLQVENIFITDANFGIHQRDVEIARKLVQTKEAYGFPQKVSWSNAKNNSNRVNEITKILSDAALIRNSLINYQTTSKRALKTMHRDKMSGKHLSKIIEASKLHGTPTTAVTIIGSPGETKEEAYQTLIDVLKEQHTSFRWNPYLVLNNAPANAPNYRNTHQIETIRRNMPLTRLDKLSTSHRNFPKAEMIVSHRNMSRSEWIDVMLANALVSGLYFMSPFRSAFEFVSQQVGTEKAFQKLLETFETGPLKETHCYLHESLQAFLDGASTYLLEIKDSRFALDLDQFIALRVLIDSSLYSESLDYFLQNAIKSLTDDEVYVVKTFQLNSVISFQNQQSRIVKSLPLTDRLRQYWGIDPSWSQAQFTFQAMENCEEPILDQFLSRYILPIVFRDLSIQRKVTVHLSPQEETLEARKITI